MKGPRIYGRYNTRENAARCIVEVSERPHYIHQHQCSRQRGYGRDGLFCKQHSVTGMDPLMRFKETS